MGGIGSGRYGWFGLTPKKTVESCFTLDVNRWNREKVLKPGIKFTWTWFDPEGNKAASINVRNHKGALELKYKHSGETIHYLVPLDFTPCNYGGKRPWFLCPDKGCGRRVAKLYANGPYFLCRHCHGLTYRSCQESGDPLKEIDNKIRRIKRKLRAGSGDIYDIPGKPKGMHWKTYNKLIGELKKLLRKRNITFYQKAQSIIQRYCKSVG